MPEQALVFSSGQLALMGIAHVPAVTASVGVVVVVGGPQYRVGSHRQFVLLARELEYRGIATLRFDYGGMGDSDGNIGTFENVGADICAAIDAFLGHCPAVRRVVLWGLCDGASACLMYAPLDRRVAGLVLLNPWVRSEVGLARTFLKTYYPRRLLSVAFWRKVLRKPTTIATSLPGLFETVRHSLGGSPAEPTDFRDRMLHGLQRFSGPTTFLLSGNDITAGEFRDLVRSAKAWRRAMGRREVHRIPLSEANHTFSRAEWRSWVVERTYEAVQRVEA